MFGSLNISISRRLWLILLVSILMLITLAGLMLKQSYDDLYSAKALQTRHLVETASGLLRHFQILAGQGLSHEQAQQRAIAVIRDTAFYVELFKPRGWIVGSGIYVGDVQVGLRRQPIGVVAILFTIVVLPRALILMFARSISSPLAQEVEAMQNIDSMTRNLENRGRHELTALSGHFNAFTSKLRSVVGQPMQTECSLDKASQALGEIACNSPRHNQQQSKQMELMAAAIHEVSDAVQEVAKIAEHATNEVRQADEQARQSPRAINSSLRQINQGNSQSAANVINTNNQAAQQTVEQAPQTGETLHCILSPLCNLTVLNTSIASAPPGAATRGRRHHPERHPCSFASARLRPRRRQEHQGQPGAWSNGGPGQSTIKAVQV